MPPPPVPIPSLPSFLYALLETAPNVGAYIHTNTLPRIDTLPTTQRIAQQQGSLLMALVSGEVTTAARLLLAFERENLELRASRLNLVRLWVFGMLGGELGSIAIILPDVLIVR